MTGMTPAWLTLMRSMAMMRSSGVRNHAVAGESGKKNLLYSRVCSHVCRVNTVIISKGRESYAPEDNGDNEGDDSGDDHQPAKQARRGEPEYAMRPFGRAYHCQGMKFSVLM